MKDCGKKCVVVLAVLVIVMGVVMAITGCEAKKCTKAPETKAVEKAPAPAKK